MSTDKDGGPAFPHPGSRLPTGEAETYPELGMSRRDWFAGQALAGICANTHTFGHAVGELAMPVATTAYAFADAMLKARASATPARGDTDGR